MLRSIAAVCVICVLGMALYAGQGNPSKTSKKKTAGSNAQTTAPKKAAAAEKAVPQGGAVVFVDPVTRQIRQATAADIGTLTTPAIPAAQGPQSPPVVVLGPGGAIGIVLSGEFQIYTVATKTPGDNLQMEEVTGEKAVQERVPAETAKPPDEKMKKDEK